MRTLVLCVAAVSLVACRDDVSSPVADEPVGSSTALVVNATAQRIVDGDTIVVSIGGRDERVRLIGIDTPESVKPDAAVECYGHEASEYTTGLVPPGTTLHLERDVEPRDDYGRILAYVFRADDGLFVNDDIVRHGYARTLRIRPNTTYADQLRRSADSARDEGLGLWGACG